MCVCVRVVSQRVDIFICSYFGLPVGDRFSAPDFASIKTSGPHLAGFRCMFLFGGRACCTGCLVAAATAAFPLQSVRSVSVTPQSGSRYSPHPVSGSFGLKVQSWLTVRGSGPWAVRTLAYKLLSWPELLTHSNVLVIATLIQHSLDSLLVLLTPRWSLARELVAKSHEQKARSPKASFCFLDSFHGRHLAS